MIKILINEEEVVSASTLTIKEEMLSTSSTILKNCYPKSWETDKDYVSRYYFPKDYAKCEIYDVDGEDETLIFCGCVKNTGNISLNPRDPHFVDLQILDFKTEKKPDVNKDNKIIIMCGDFNSSAVFNPRHTYKYTHNNTSYSLH